MSTGMLTGLGELRVVARGKTSKAGTITIPAVNMNKAFVVSSCTTGHKSFSGSNSYAYAVTAAVSIQSATQLSVTVRTGLDSDFTLSWEVVEWVN